MGKLNEIQQQTTQSYGSNSFTTTIKEDTVEFDSAKDKFTFKDPVEVPSINVNGQESVAFTSEDRVKLDNLQTPMQIKGRVDSVADLENIENPSVGDTYLVGLSGSETFEEYVCIGFSGSPEQAEWENVGTTQKQSDWNQNDNTKADYIKNRTHYVETIMSTVFNDTVSVTTMSQDNIYFYQGQTELTEEFEIEEGQTYKVTKDGVEYEIVATEFQHSNALIYGNLEELESGSFAITIQRQLGFGNGKGGTVELVVMGISSNEVSNVSLKIEAETESVHTLADKYLSDNIARVSDLQEQAFNIDESNYNIYPTFTNDSNTVNTGSSLILATPSTSNNSFGGSNNVSIVGANSSNTISGGYNIAILTAPATTVGGNNNLVISAYGGSQTVDNSETASILIGGVGGVTMTGGGYQKTMIQPFYGSQILGDHSSIICGAGKVQGGYSSIYNAESSSNEIYGNSNIIIGGGQTFTAKIGNTSHQTNVGNSIVANANGTGTITDGAGNTIAFCQGGSFTITGGATNTILGCNGSATISGGIMNLIIGGYGSITIPDTTSNTIVLGNPAGGSAFTATESNTVYVPTLKATTGVSTKKLTISSIDPTDVFMHSEIIDASSDVSFSRVLANTSSTKTDGYVEILYKASSGVTCSAYIDSTDVTLTADGGWHKLEQGCDPANGVEIHINNSSPVTDATLEVISKVYYI